MKTNIFPLSIFILLTIPFLVNAQEPDWLVRLKNQKWMEKVNQIKILKTNRIEAEKILGEPDKFDSKTSNISEYYTLKHGRVWVQYTTKECTSTNGKVKKDSVEEFDFSLEDDISFTKLVSQLKIPLKQFEYSRQSDNPGENYKNERLGIDISVQHNKVDSISFFIPEHKNFNCVTIPSLLKDLSKVKEINLLETNRDELRKLFPNYKFFKKRDYSEYKERFDTTSAIIEFSYSTGKCIFNDSEEYNSPEWSVTGITILPESSLAPKDFGIDLTKYKKEKVYKNVAYRYVYHDKNSGISFDIFQGKINAINFFPSQKYYSQMCDQQRAKILSSTDSLFTEKLKDRIYTDYGRPSNVEKIHLSQTELTVGSQSSMSNDKNNCSDNTEIIEVFVKATNPYDDGLTFSYTISGGKIIGQGSKVIWDLSGAKAGIYEITVATDDGCGFCGKTMTKKVMVKECSECKNK